MAGLVSGLMGNILLFPQISGVSCSNVLAMPYSNYLAGNVGNMQIANM
jgi:hypothetical protein